MQDKVNAEDCEPDEVDSTDEVMHPDWLAICNEEDADGQGRVITDEE